MTVRRPPAPEPHQIVDLSLDIQLEGAFDAVYVDGDNSGCLPTDTMKNTVYAFARRDPIDQVEAFGLRLAEHFAAKPLVSRVRVAATEHRWQPLAIGGRPHPHAFVQPGGEQWTAVITRDANGCDVTSGLTNLVVLKTGRLGVRRIPARRADDAGGHTRAPSGDVGHGHLEIPRRDVGLLGPRRGPCGAGRDVRRSRERVGAAHAVRDGRGRPGRVRAIWSRSRSTLPNRHHLLVDLSPFGLDNPNEVFVATDQPFGVIEATVRR